MESEIIEIAQGNLAAISAIMELCKEFGEDTVLHTVLPVIKQKKIGGKDLGQLFYKECNGNAITCGIKLCPLLKIYEKRQSLPVIKS